MKVAAVSLQALPHRVRARAHDQQNQLQQRCSHNRGLEQLQVEPRRQAHLLGPARALEQTAALRNRAADPIDSP